MATSPTAGLLAAPPEQRPVAALEAAAHGVPIRAIRAAADGCRACHLWARATQTVFGTGPVPAPLMLVGEQPGDREDLDGQPFVGPAGRILDRALDDAGIDRERAFVTNVVKHFKWRPSGKRRLHERPNREEVGACLPWVESELALVRPQALVLLGATAAQAMVDPTFSVMRNRGRPLGLELAPFVMATVHPSSILRAGERRESAYAALVADLSVAAAWLREHAA
jgi:DNA polymerase